MSKYKIVHKCGYTHLYKDGEEIKYLQSIEFSRKNADEMATLTIKVLCPEMEIEIDNNNEKELTENKIPNISVELGGKELLKKAVAITADTIILNGNVITKKELAEDQSTSSKTIQSPQEIINKTVSKTLTNGINVKIDNKEITNLCLQNLANRNSFAKEKIPFICQGERCGSKEILNKQEIINRIVELLDVNEIEKIEVRYKKS